VVLQAGAVARQLAEYEALAGNPRVRAMLDTIAFAEGADYNVMFTGKRFDSTKGWQHPRTMQRSSGYASDAAGRYQFLSTTWDEVAKQVGLKDFSPRNQDIAALRLMERRGVDLKALAAGDPTADTFAKLAPEWASLPTREGRSFYGQPVKGLDKLMGRYRQSLSATGAPPAAGATFQSPGGQAGAATGGMPLAASGGVFADVKQDSPLPMPGQGVELGMDARSLALGGVMAAAAAAGAGPGLQFLAGAAEQSRQKQRMAGGELMAQALGIQPQAAAPAQVAPTTQQMLAGQAPAQAPAPGALQGGPVTKSVSTSFDRGQPGIDLYWEDKGFRSLLPGRIKDIGYQGSGRGASGKGYGNYVVKEAIDPETGKPVDVLYAHLDEVNVKKGQEVGEGAIIGKQGGTGRVLSQDGTIASIDFLAPAPAGSGSMTPYAGFDRLRRRLAKRWSA
jgi:muramidase (phage lysozyme)